MYSKFNMDTLLTRIAQLPQFLQDYIAEYNVEHRLLMKKVFSELEYFYKDYPCDNCECLIQRKKSIHAIILFNDFFYCSDWCWYDSETEFRKAYLRALRN